ncbi:hypothetical protein [Paenibacillus radicis (ex Gao et al. 2016)]|uniref:PQQ-binding-like beta-propeller repeat protein n=1 Tax=Paenibacillus radicis (ex Gao et al. 2016) TaxID=1737354 RepID=A0A917LWN9_9BACL|nr:hypothetical protein [Paenibacillus radicis (ex Gao et al. 2016)]GGG60164.1 hypothetical protein GCM10010918_11720 [Paenibacillus radicis (ex Gao et al. 2016)]
MSKLAIRSFLLLSIVLLLLASNQVYAQGTLKQIPTSQFTTLKINGQNHGQFRGSLSFKFNSLSLVTQPKDLYYSPKTKLTYSLGNFNVFKNVNENVLKAFDTSGKLKWKVNIQEEGYQSLIYGEEDILFVHVTPLNMINRTEPNVLYAFDLNGHMKWKYIFPEAQQMFLPIWHVGPKGAFYTITNDAIVCIQDGKMKWEVKMPTKINELDQMHTSIVSIFVDGTGNLYTKDVEDWVEKRDPDHRLVWKRNLGSGRLELVGGDQYFLSIKHTSLRYYSTKTGNSVNSPVIDYKEFDGDRIPNDTKGGFYAAEKEDSIGLSSGNGVVKFNEKGQILWHYKMRFNGYASVATGSLRSDSQGNVYFLDNGGRLYSLDSNGNERFIVLTRDIGGSFSPLYVSPDGTAVSSNGDVGTYMITSIKKS